MRYPFIMTTSRPITHFLVVLSCFTLMSCAHTRSSVEGSNEAQADAAEKTTEKATEKTPEQNSQYSLMQARIQDLETRITAMNEKLNERLDEKAVQKPNQPEAKVIRPSIAAAKGIPHEEIMQDEAIDRYREAKIIFDSNRFSDSVLEFSDFVKNFSQHVFAPAAQYYLGAAYYKQKEFKIAEEEWSRGLISFPHSQFTADTLRGLMEVSTQLNKPEKTTYFSQRLLMLFPNSPQAKGVVARTASDQGTASTMPESAIPAHEVQTTEVPAVEEKSAIEKNKLINKVMQRKEGMSPHQLMEKPIPDRTERPDRIESTDEPTVEDGGR